LHQLGVKLGYAMPNSKKELTTLLALGRDFKNQQNKKIPAILTEYVF